MNKAVGAGSLDPFAVLVVEDDPRARGFLEQSIRASPRLRWLAGLGTVAEALQWLDGAAEAPDVLLVDIGLPDGDGVAVIRAAVKRHPRCDPLVLSMLGDAHSVLASIEAGAVGYLHKDAPPADIVRTLLDVKAGASPISPMIARCVLARYRSLQADTAPEAAPAAVPGAPALLSGREQEVLQLIARGFKEAQCRELAGWIADILEHLGDADVEAQVAGLAAGLCADYPVYR